MRAHCDSIGHGEDSYWRGIQSAHLHGGRRDGPLTVKTDVAKTPCNRHARFACRPVYSPSSKSSAVESIAGQNSGCSGRVNRNDLLYKEAASIRLTLRLVPNSQLERHRGNISGRTGLSITARTISREYYEMEVLKRPSNFQPCR